jgi:hypothetical protein
MASKRPLSHLAWRDAGTGRFITEAQAVRKPKETVVHERIPVPGKGISKK